MKRFYPLSAKGGNFIDAIWGQSGCLACLKMKCVLATVSSFAALQCNVYIYIYIYYVCVYIISRRPCYLFPVFYFLNCYIIM